MKFLFFIAKVDILKNKKTNKTKKIYMSPSAL